MIRRTIERALPRLLPWFCVLVVLICGFNSLLVNAPLAWRGWAYIGVHFSLTLLMLGAWFGLHLHSSVLHTKQESTPDHQQKQALLWVLIAGIVSRLLLIDTPAFTTHDVQRYLWDGAVAINGLDPYRVAPDSPLAQTLRSYWPTPEEHAAYPTLYPPLALALFAFSALAGKTGGIWCWKILVTAASLGSLLLGYRWLLRRGTPQHLPLLALSPLLLLETGVGAHVDAFSALAVIAALYAFETGRRGTAGFLIGLGALIKLLPLVLLLPFSIYLLRARQARQTCTLILGALSTVAIGYGVALLLHLRPVGSIGLLFQRWRFGSPLYAALEANFSMQTAAALALICLLMLLAASAWHAWRAATSHVKDISTSVQLALAAPLLVSPVTFPWYLCAFLPALLMRPRFSTLIWVSAVPLSYEVLNAFDSTGVWAPATWPLWVIGFSILLGLLVDVFRSSSRFWSLKR